MAEGNPIKYSDLVIDDGAIDRLLNAIDTLEKRFLQSQKNFRKEIDKTKKSTEDFTGATEDQESELEKLEKQLEKLIKANKELQDTDGQLTEQKKQAVKIAKDEAKLRKKLIELDSEQTKVNAELKIDISEKNKLIKEQIKREKGLTNAYDDESKSLNNLRKKYKALAVEGKENTKEAKALLFQVTALDKKLKAIDQSVGQTQRSVGNYKEQVKEAIEETGVFTESMAGAVDQSGALGEVISKLQTIIAFLTKITQNNTVSTEVNSTATEVQTFSKEALTTSLVVNKKATISETGALVKNTTATSLATKVQKTFAKSILFTTKSFGKLKAAMIKSGIGFVIVALATVVSALTESTAGVDGLAKNMTGLSFAFKVIFGRIALFGKGIIDVVQGIIAGFDALNKASKFNFEGAKKSFSEAGDQFSQAGESFSKASDGFIDAVKHAFESGKKYSEMTKKLEKDTIGWGVAIAKLNAESEKQEEIESDATKSFKERRIAIEKSIIAQQKSADLSKKRAKADLDKEKVSLNAFTKGTQSRLNQSIIVAEKQIAFIEAESEADIKSKALQKNRNMLLQDELEKNLDILIDGFDNQKTINEQLIASDKLRFDERRKLILETKKLQENALADEVFEINKVSKAKIDINDLIATSDSQLLNKKIRGYELSEILEGRLLEVVREARTQVRDLDQAQIDLDKEHFDIRKKIIEELQNLKAENIENEKIQSLELQRLEEKRAIEGIELEQKKFKFSSDEFRKLEATKTEIRQKGIEDRETIEIEALERENDREQKVLEWDLIHNKKNQEEINDELTKLKIEQLTKEIDLEEEAGRDAIDKQLELAKLKREIEVDQEKKKADAIKKIQDVTADAIFTSFQKTLDKQINELDRLEEKQQTIVDNQTARAIAGLENNLAFEEDALAELEQKKIKAQKKQIALEKISALYNAYSSASASGESNAIIKVLRDFSILQGIESAISSFGSGTGEHGSIEDSLSANQNGSKGGNSIQNGVVRGESHKKRGFGVPVLVEGNEGIWKGSTMDKFGKNNFVALTKAIDSGAIGSNFMQPQVNAMQVVQTGGSDPRLLNEMVATRKAIENKPEQVVDVEKFSRNVIDFIDERKTGNKTIINRHRVTRKRF